MKLLRLPLEFWSMDVFRAICDSVNTFLEANDNFMHSKSYSIPYTLIEVNMREGLENEISLVVRG
jgi:hypothetical protein